MSSLSKLRLPVIGAPMFLLSSPELVIASCRAGILGNFLASSLAEAGGDPKGWGGKSVANLVDQLEGEYRSALNRAVTLTPTPV